MSAFCGTVTARHASAGAEASPAPVVAAPDADGCNVSADAGDPVPPESPDACFGADSAAQGSELLASLALLAVLPPVVLGEAAASPDA